MRVLDDDGQAVGPWADEIADLTEDDLRQGLPLHRGSIQLSFFLHIRERVE